jgi:signal transduction histidine kinase
MRKAGTAWVPVEKGDVGLMSEVHPNFDSRANRRHRGQTVLPPVAVSTRLPEDKRLASALLLHLNDTKRRSYERTLGKLVVELAQTREKERQKIANHLHDEIGQNLILAAIKLGRLEMTASKRQAPIVHQIHELISSVIQETRSLMCDLYPQALRDLGLTAALDGLIERTRLNYDLQCTAELGPVPQALPEDIAETIFYAVRELLINTAKHARAKQAKLIFRTGEHLMLIEVIDDGQGFEASRLSPPNPGSGGFGLLTVRERLSGIGGSMYIDSNPGRGTKIILTIPKSFEKRES